MLSGSFWIDKPAGLTSSDVVVRLKIALTKNGYCQHGFKIGHGGTLDPFATGAMVVLVGEGTKLADTYLHSKKAYSGIINLGSKTDTADCTGTVVEQKPILKLSPEDWQKLADSFTVDEYWQTPPMYSAKKKDGKALHELARQGIDVERKAILKKIDSFIVKPFSETELTFEVHCESGTYVRVIAEDLAVKAGTVAHLKTLVRIQSSDVVLEKCAPLDQVLLQLSEKKPIDTVSAFHSMQLVSTHIPSVDTSEKEAELLLQGKVDSVHKIIHQFIAGTRSDRYFLARLADQRPVALFERTSESGSLLKPSYRLQRILLWNDREK